MDGRPWLRIAAVVVGFLLVGVPVWSATMGHAKERTAPVRMVKPAPTASLHLDVFFTRPPSSFEVSNAGRVVLRGGGANQHYSADWSGNLPPEGADFLIKASWPSGATESATRVQVSHDDVPVADQTFWSETALVDTVTVPGGN